MEFLQVSGNQKDVYHCPYNSSHTMPKKTVSLHLGRCPDKPPNYTHCSFNYSHVILVSGKMTHEENCPNRLIIDSILYESEDVVRPNVIVQAAHVIVEDESWDNEVVAPIQANVQDHIMLMKPRIGLTKSQRKNQRALISNYSNIDCSFDRNCSIGSRPGSSSNGAQRPGPSHNGAQRPGPSYNGAQTRQDKQQ